MRHLHIQIQPERSTELDVQAAITRLKALAAESRVTEVFDKVAYINIDLRSPDIRSLWELVEAELNEHSELKRVSIVVCQGRRGWDDYLLLHHFDGTQPLETLT